MQAWSQLFYQWELSGLQVIREIQLYRSPVLDFLFQLVTFFGGGHFFLVLIPVIYWVCSPRVADRVGIIFLLTTMINLCLKQLFARPRPFQIDPSLEVVAHNGFGIPSGHAQVTAVTFLLLLLFTRPSLRKKLLPPTLILLFLIGLSRLYLGLHFPSDVLFGWLVATSILIIYSGLGQKVEQVILRVSPHTRRGTILALGLFFAFLVPEKGMLARVGWWVGLTFGRLHFSFSSPQLHPLPLKSILRGLSLYCLLLLAIHWVKTPLPPGPMPKVISFFQLLAAGFWTHYWRDKAQGQ